jgi:cation:H+ antiporter
VELAFLGAASIYAFVIPLKGTLSILDAVVLLSLFIAYLWRTSRQTREEPDLHGLASDR